MIFKCKRKYKIICSPLVLLQNTKFPMVTGLLSWFLTYSKVYFKCISFVIKVKYLIGHLKMWIKVCKKLALLWNIKYLMTKVWLVLSWQNGEVMFKRKFKEVVLQNIFFCNDGVWYTFKDILRETLNIWRDVQKLFPNIKCPENIWR